MPQVFADQQPKLMTTERHDTGLRASAEVALLIEHPVVRQILLEVTSDQFALLIEGRCVVERLSFTPGVTHQDGALASPG
ncbi:hypothetical protein D3C84_1087330 [compost metagenome]